MTQKQWKSRVLPENRRTNIHIDETKPVKQECALLTILRVSSSGKGADTHLESVGIINEARKKVWCSTELPNPSTHSSTKETGSDQKLWYSRASGAHKPSALKQPTMIGPSLYLIVLQGASQKLIICSGAVLRPRLQKKTCWRWDISAATYSRTVCRSLKWWITYWDVICRLIRWRKNLVKSELEDTSHTNL